MYIVPNTTIRILKGVNLDNTYKHTIYFDNASVQTNYFISKNKYTLTNYSYQRQQKTLKIGIKSDDLFDCNYLMFQNTSFGSKWFYAFITNVEYINNDTSEITFEIDVMQTWFFDYQVRQSFVEREHSSTDNVGDNVIEENLELGEYISLSDTVMASNKTNNTSIVIACTFNENMEDVEGGEYSGIYSGLNFIVCDSWQHANEIISDATSTIGDKSQGIVSIFECPTAFITDKGEERKSYDIMFLKNIPSNKGKEDGYTNVNGYKRIGTIDGYAPKNNKLYTYPYNLMYVTDLNGNHAEFRYELFDSFLRCDFQMVGSMGCNPQIIMYPLDYKGLELNYNERMFMSGYPQCAWSNDTFKAYLAQNASSIAASFIATGAGMVSGNLPMALGGMGGIGSAVIKSSQTISKPPQAHGTASTDALLSLSMKDFVYIPMTIRSDYAKIIDEYFSMFGYATKRVKIPNLKTRKEWNYVKTIDVTLTGSIPANALSKLKSIYNSGVTFWHRGNNVGMYNLDNGVI